MKILTGLSRLKIKWIKRDLRSPDYPPDYPLLSRNSAAKAPAPIILLFTFIFYINLLEANMFAT
jgi:hypothetical protein